MKSVITPEQATLLDTARAAAIAYGYTAQANGELRAPQGKFENEPYFAIYYWSAAMDGDGESFGNDERVDCDVFEVHNDERTAFELDAAQSHMLVRHYESGKVSVERLTQAEYEALQRVYAKPEYTVAKWEERDRLHINLTGTDGTDLDWWDDDARQMFDDGFFEARRLDDSVIEYARERGLLGSKTK